jgi:hypothetical protein
VKLKLSTNIDIPPFPPVRFGKRSVGALEFYFSRGLSCAKEVSAGKISECQNMAKILLLSFVAVVFLLQHCEASLKCYYCLEACEVSKAQEKVCGQNIGASQEAVCTTDVAKDSKSPSMAVRKCQIVTKDGKAPCSDQSTCTQCKTELCNAATSVAPNMAVVGAVAAYLAAKFLLH